MANGLVRIAVSESIPDTYWSRLGDAIEILKQPLASSGIESPNHFLVYKPVTTVRFEGDRRLYEPRLYINGGTVGGSNFGDSAFASLVALYVDMEGYYDHAPFWRKRGFPPNLDDPSLSVRTITPSVFGLTPPYTILITPEKLQVAEKLVSKLGFSSVDVKVIGQPQANLV